MFLRDMISMMSPNRMVSIVAEFVMEHGFFGWCTFFYTDNRVVGPTAAVLCFDVVNAGYTIYDLHVNIMGVIGCSFGLGL